MFCPKCGNELKPGTKFCNKCGASQEVPSSKEPVRMKPNTEKRPTGGKTPPKGSGKKKGKGCLIALIVALVIAVLLGAGGFAGYKLGLFDSLLDQKTEETAADNDKKDKKNSKSKDDEEDDDKDTDNKKSRDKKDRDKKDEDDEDEDMTADSSEEEETSETESTAEQIKLSELLGQTSAAAETTAETTVPREAETVTSANESVPTSEAYPGSTSGTPAGDGAYILPDSSSRRLTEQDLAGLNKEQLKIARNEIYARHGRMFNSEELQFYFNSKSWYRGTISPSAFSEDLLSQVEKDNVQLIIKKEESMP